MDLDVVDKVNPGSPRDCQVRGKIQNMELNCGGWQVLWGFHLLPGTQKNNALMTIKNKMLNFPPPFFLSTAKGKSSEAISTFIPFFAISCLYNYFFIWVYKGWSSRAVKIAHIVMQLLKNRNSLQSKRQFPW